MITRLSSGDSNPAGPGLVSDIVLTRGQIFVPQAAKVARTAGSGIDNRACILRTLPMAVESP